MITFTQQPTLGGGNLQRAFQTAMRSIPISALTACTFATFMTGAAAQDADTVTISNGGSDSITGEIVELSAEQIILQTTAGLITIPTEGTTCTGAACPAALTTKPALGEIVLTTADNTLSIAGTLLGIEDDQYVLSTDAGVMRIGVEGMQCAGAGCIGNITATASLGEQMVSLSNGSTTIDGKLLQIEENAYVIRHDTLGEIRVRIDQFECSGEGCPKS
jgi:uncharacterized protein YdeI (BOF family)